MTAAAARRPPAPAPRELPIIFTGAMVRALIAGRKSQTRRLIKPQPPGGCEYTINGAGDHALCFAIGTARTANPVCVPPTARSVDHRLPCPYGKPGDRLWVREGYHNDALTLDEARRVHEDAMSASPLFYRADKANQDAGCRWRPAIFLPRWASRLLLEMTDLRVQRLDEITREDAIAEGCPRSVGYDVAGAPEKWFRTGWDLMHAREAPASSNPWVWAITFDVVEGLADV